MISAYIMTVNNGNCYLEDTNTPIPQVALAFTDMLAHLRSKTKKHRLLVGYKSYSMNGLFIPNTKYAILTRTRDKARIRGVKAFTNVMDIAKHKEDIEVVSGIQTFESCFPITSVITEYRLNATDTNSFRTFNLPENFYLESTTEAQEYTKYVYAKD